ncbi:sugar-binding domain-containing protein, partial [Clostridium perfringens]
KWEFNYFDSLQKVKEFVNINKINFSDHIDVPSLWKLKGYDYNQYTNVKYTIPFDPPFVPINNQCGINKRFVEIEILH